MELTEKGQESNLNCILFEPQEDLTESIDFYLKQIPSLLNLIKEKNPEIKTLMGLLEEALCTYKNYEFISKNPQHTFLKVYSILWCTPNLNKNYQEANFDLKATVTHCE